MTDSANRVPKSNRRLRCSCPKTPAGEWIRDVDTDHGFLIDPYCQIHGRKAVKEFEKSIAKNDLQA